MGISIDLAIAGVIVTAGPSGRTDKLMHETPLGKYNLYYYYNPYL